MQRRIELNIKSDHLGRILKDLGIIETEVQFNSADNTFRLNIEEQESAELFKKLSTDSGILSWDFNEEPEETKPEISEDDSSLVQYITNYNKAAIWIEAVWKMSKKSPNLIFGSQLFKEKLALEYNEVAGNTVTVEHALLCMILENYYKDTVDFKTSYEDIVEKIKNNWKGLDQHPSLASIAKLWS